MKIRKIFSKILAIVVAVCAISEFTPIKANDEATTIYLEYGKPFGTGVGEGWSFSNNVLSITGVGTYQLNNSDDNIELLSTISVQIGTENGNGDVVLSDGTFNGPVTVYVGCTISGGTFNGTVAINYGTISGGIFNGTVSDNGKITGGTFYSTIEFGSDYETVSGAKIPVPTAKTGLVFNNNYQTGVAEGTGYTVTNGEQDAAGTYTATAKLKSGYLWTDGTSDDKYIVWTISEPQSTLTSVTAPTSPADLSYNGKTQTGVPAKTGYTVETGSAKDIGSYTATATLASGYQWSDGSTNKKKISWKIVANENYTNIAAPTAVSGLVYNGQLQTGIADGTGYTVTDGTAINAGVYTATVKLVSGYQWNDGSSKDKSISWVIVHASAAFPVAENGLVYNRQQQVGVRAGTGYTVTGGSSAEVGTHTATAKLTSNYVWVDATTEDMQVYWTISPATATIPTVKTGLTYTGQAQTGVASGTGYTVTGGTETAAGNYTATATLSTGYIWSDNTSAPKSISWSIAPSSSIPLPTVNSVSISPLAVNVKKGSNQTFTATVSVANGADQTVTWSIEGSHVSGTSINNGVLTVAADETAQSLTIKAASTVTPSKYGISVVTIQSAPSLVSIDVPAAVSTLIYNGQEQTGVASGTGYTVANGTASKAGSYIAVATLASGYIWSDSTTEAKSVNWSIAKKNITADLIANGFSKVYDGTTAVNQPFALNTNYSLTGVADGDDVSIAANTTGIYNDKNAGDNKTISFTSIALTGMDAENYTISSTLAGNAGQITKKAITGALSAGHSFDKVYDGKTTASLADNYVLNGIISTDQVQLSAAKGSYDSSVIGDRAVTFSGLSINESNYILTNTDTLTGTGKITLENGLTPTDFIDSSKTNVKKEAVLNGDNQILAGNNTPLNGETVRFDVPLKELIAVSIFEGTSKENLRKFLVTFEAKTAEDGVTYLNLVGSPERVGYLKSGSTIITLYKSYLDTFGAGTYYIHADYEASKFAEATFTITDPASAVNKMAESQYEEAKTNYETANTADGSGSACWGTVLVISLGIAAVCLKRKYQMN